MDKQRKGQFLLILSIVVLTIYNILPTVFYYLKPLTNPISPVEAEHIATTIESRIYHLEKETENWLKSYCDLIQVKPISIRIDPNNLQNVLVSFAQSRDARRLREKLPRAGSLIPFAPAQLSLATQDENSKEVCIKRQIPIRLQKKDFSYHPKHDKLILRDRIEKLALILAGPSETSHYLNTFNPNSLPINILETLASQIYAISDILKDDSAIGSRFAARFTLGDIANRQAAIQTLIDSFTLARDTIRKEKARINGEPQAQTLQALEAQETRLLMAEKLLKKHAARFAAGKDAWTPLQIRQALDLSETLTFTGIHPLFSELSIDFSKDRIVLKLYPDLAALRASGEHKERLEQMIVDEIARIARLSNENLIPTETEISIPLHRLPNVSGYLVLDQKKLAERLVDQVQIALNAWQPRHPDLQNLTIVDFKTYKTLPKEQKALSIVIACPLISTDNDLQQLNPNSLYVAVKGIDKLAKIYEQFPESQQAIDLNTDFHNLSQMLHQNGFRGYSGSPLISFLADQGDFIFEKSNFSDALLAATREDFIVRGTTKIATLELSDVEQRILTDNKIETRIHEDLLKWKDEYRAASISIDPAVHFDVPRPNRSIFWSNVVLSARKYFRGDDRKIIRWGLDLSGGKTVQIELRDANRQVVTNAADLKQGINELYNRVNKMGVSEVSIRQLGHHIILDFPGSQAMSASELIKASTMYFHVVNEKFSSANSALSNSVNQFLQEIWNEACVTNRKDAQSINDIALKHLQPEKEVYRSEAAQTLWENGLRLTSWNDSASCSNVDDSVSKIAIFRGSDFTEWHGQSHPLLIVFRNWAIEGSGLENIHPGYDPGKGNFLSFDIAATHETGGRVVQPRKDLFAWTSHYSKEQILGTSLENYSRGKGWRMAVILNDFAISAPTLESSLKDSAQISGSFSQNEVNRLAADLKAGSLTFTPQILSEKNVSPELGKSDRLKGIAATIVALFSVIGAMVIYYRFAGFIASIAVIFNLLILWATLQNLGATLTLAGLAGVILTVGMAVDANVLVFERIKEEFRESKNIRSAISAGYRKAYSAILDSNITTIIAALILLNFDAGPIKSFAVNLIIGIASSMFTALFMTRFYFTGWLQNPKHQLLKMADWIRSSSFDFLKWTKIAFISSSAIVVIGCFLVCSERLSIFGMDFTGGYSLNLELEERNDQDYAGAAERAFLRAGAATGDFQIRELNPPNHLRVLFGMTLEQVGKPFYQMPEEVQQENPRIRWATDALQKEGVFLSPHCVLKSNWTAMSGQMSDSMRKNALLGLALAFICIFIYLAFRFEYKFAAAALICLFHDVLITVGLIGLLHFVGVTIQIDLNTIAALMTIVGYSLNDTIIIFDRIREEMQSSKGSLTQIANRALNATLSRTTITSGTTLLVLIVLVFLGGPSIFGFSLVMAMGVLFGTLSSWFIATPLLIFFDQREKAKTSQPCSHAE